jgi:hypothetical protein
MQKGKLKNKRKYMVQNLEDIKIPSVPLLRSFIAFVEKDKNRESEADEILKSIDFNDVFVLDLIEIYENFSWAKNSFYLQNQMVKSLVSNKKMFSDSNIKLIKDQFLDCFEDTVLLDSEKIKTLLSWTKATKKKTWKLLFRASKDGYNSKEFHDICDNQGPTLIVRNFIKIRS